MNGKDNKKSTAATHGRGRSNGSTGVVIFLAILAVLLAVGGAILLRQMLSARHDAQVAAIEINQVNEEKAILMAQLDELDAKFASLATEHQEMEGQLNTERRRVRQLRAQLSGDPEAGGPAIERYRQRIEELEVQLEGYRQQVESLEAEKQMLSSETAQMRTTLSQTTARNQQLESRTQELEEQIEKAALLTISNLNATALRERRRGDEPTDRARRTDKLRICFTINENPVARPGNRDFFIRLINPANQVLTLSPDNTLVFEGETIQYSIKRTVNYQTSSQEVCAVWNQDERFQSGYYNVVVFQDNREVGYKLFQLD